MTDKEKLIEYELQIEDMLNAVNERLAAKNILAEGLRQLA